MNQHLKKAEEELMQVEELLDIDFCDDGLVFHHLQNSVKLLLKALAEEYKLDLSENLPISELIRLLESKTTLKFPQWIDSILEIEDISVPDGCATSICYDVDMYGDILDAVYQLKEFVSQQVEQ
ncbi:HEPN domain-containing protein [Persephonella sp.]